MKKKKNTVTVNPNPLYYQYPYYVKIEDGDKDSISYYIRNGVPICYIHWPHRMLHFYAVFNAESQKEADSMNRLFNNWDKKEYRDTKVQMENEVSYEKLVEEGFDVLQIGTNPEEIVVYRVQIHALNKALDELTEEEIRYCKVVADKESEYEVSKEMRIHPTMLSARKNAALEKLGKKMKDYR
jgi:hypothetical protein|nr:hypothetical protein [uncultured Schaedlerella sp.]